MELLLDPALEAHGAHRLHVAGPRAVAEAVQGVDDAGVVVRGAAGAAAGAATAGGHGQRQASASRGPAQAVFMSCLLTVIGPDAAPARVEALAWRNGA